ncbi:ferredoxin [candidate division KSB1 bacterium]|jgi:ferredoxin|nr:ferredoxin [candidate division KSB1 bacterium]
MKVKIDEDLCTACELCTDTAPEIFEMGDDVAKVIVDVVPEDQEELARECAESCPAECIFIEE